MNINEITAIHSIMKRMGLHEGTDNFSTPQGDKESDVDYWERRLNPNIETESDDIEESTNEHLEPEVYKKRVETKDGKYHFGDYLSDDEIEILNKSWPEMSKMIAKKPNHYQLP